jgi:DNA-binding transcriptional ArsR family regulator
MTQTPENPYDALERIFHEPNRLSIMSAVCAADSGITFSELKATCGLTDGNLNRHLKVLAQAGAVKIDKAFVDGKPRTTVTISKKGLDQFNRYLAALSEVLKEAKRAMPVEKKSKGVVIGAKTVRA